MGFVDFARRYPKLFFVARCIKNINNPNCRKLINGYLDMQGDSLSLLIYNSRGISERKIIYDISIGSDTFQRMGFCAMLYRTVWYLWFAERMSFLPRVKWGEGCFYYDCEMDNITKNVFEYYFIPISDININDLSKEAFDSSICICDERHINHVGYSFAAYTDFNDSILSIHAEIYKKNIHLNALTRQYLSDELSKIFQQGTILGVHVRGTDFKKGFKNHPIAVTFRTYLDETKELFSTGKYEKIFLATDDVEALELFNAEFKEKLVTYSDAFRTEGNCSPHTTNSNRPLHHYKLGLEVLRDVYTLANCDGLVCGLSNVSFAARYISMSLDKKYEDIIVLDNGISKENSKAAKKARKLERKKDRAFKKHEC